MEERYRLIQEYLDGEDVAELARMYEVSRKTAYKWIVRYETGGMENLADQSRAPQNHPNTVSERTEERIVELRAEHPRWGPKKLWHWLEREEPGGEWPAISTIGSILNRRGLAWARKPKRHASVGTHPLGVAEEPNQVWCTDYKGWFPCGNGQICYPLTLTDAASRYLIRCQGLRQATRQLSKPVYEAAFREFGLPDAMRSDNGPPFAGTGTQGLTQLNVWWIRLGIQLQRIRPGKPQQNGSHERMHRTLKAETACPPQANLRAQQASFDAFAREFNQQRPHEALAFATPASRYQPSARPYPAKLPELEYPAHFYRRKAGPNGEISWDCSWLFVGRALAGEHVGIEPIDFGPCRLWFGTLLLGEFDPRADLQGKRRRRGVWLKLHSPSGLPPPEPDPAVSP